MLTRAPVRRVQTLLFIKSPWDGEGLESIPNEGQGFWLLLRRSLLFPAITSDRPVTGRARTPPVVAVGHTRCEAIARDAVTVRAYQSLGCLLPRRCGWELRK